MAFRGVVHHDVRTAHRSLDERAVENVATQERKA
jgi:hypothetical protein